MRVDEAVKYFRIARVVADELSEDPSTKVATILLKRDTYQILSTGHNGFARGVDGTRSERWERPSKYDFCVHSEISSICNAAMNGVCVDGAVAVVTLYPCCGCCRALIQAGIRTLVTLPPDFDDNTWGDQFRTSKVMMEEAGIDVVLLSEEIVRGVAAV